MGRESTDTIPGHILVPAGPGAHGSSYTVTLRYIRVHTLHTWTLCLPMHRLLQSHGNFIVSVSRVMGGALVMIEAQEAATEGAHVAVPEALVPAMITVTAWLRFTTVHPVTPCAKCSVYLRSLILTSL